MTKNLILTPQGMLADIMRQGFMKPLKKAKAKAKKPAPKVKACDRCQDWHSGSCKKFQQRKAEYLAAKR